MGDKEGVFLVVVNFVLISSTLVLFDNLNPFVLSCDRDFLNCIGLDDRWFKMLLTGFGS